MKANKTILNLVERAQAKGYAEVNRKGQQVYRIQIDTFGAYLFHYGTLIARVIRGQGEVGKGAYSPSDRDAINNFFDALGLDTRVAIRKGVLQVA